jgi:hypothetical protein
MKLVHGKEEQSGGGQHMVNYNKILVAHLTEHAYFIAKGFQCKTAMKNKV